MIFHPEYTPRTLEHTHRGMHLQAYTPHPGIPNHTHTQLCASRHGHTVTVTFSCISFVTIQPVIVLQLNSILTDLRETTVTSTKPGTETGW